MLIGPASVVVRSQEPVSAVVENTLVLFSAERGKYYVFDEISTAIWRGLEQPTAVAELSLALERDFDVDAARCQAEVLQFLRQLEPRGLIRVVA